MQIGWVCLKGTGPQGAETEFVRLATPAPPRCGGGSDGPRLARQWRRLLRPRGSITQLNRASRVSPNVIPQSHQTVFADRSRTAASHLFARSRTILTSGEYRRSLDNSLA